MGPDSTSSLVTVVVHTFDRPEFLEEDLRAGHWQGIPLLISDDASRPEVQVRLEDIAREFDLRFTARVENGGPARAAHDGAEAAGTPFFVLCGDDDYFRDFAPFAHEASTLLRDDGVLLAALPEVRFVIPGQPQKLQYDRRVFDGMTGHALLKELIFGGEMRALQAGAMLRTQETLPHFASSLFRTSEDFILICRLCTERPEAVVRVTKSGAYMRREHASSLSHKTNMSTERAVTNLLALLVGGRLLQTLEPIEDAVLLGLLRQRAQVVATIYGAGMGSLAVLEALLGGTPPPQQTDEMREALVFLRTHADQLPRELVRLKAVLRTLGDAAVPTTPEQLLKDAESAFGEGDVAEAADRIARINLTELDRPAAGFALKARLEWAQNEPNEAVASLSSALVHEPDHADALHMLAQIARAAGEEDAARRLENRMIAAIGVEAAAEHGLEWHDETDDLKLAFIVSAGLDQFLDDIIRELVPHMDARKVIVSSQEDILQAMDWADACWFEWCNDPVIWASRQDLMRQKPTICRLHRYEAFSDMPLKVQWEQVDSLVVVARHLADIVSDAIPGLAQRTQIRHIPNGVDMRRFDFLERSAGFNIALIGYLHGRKNPQMALQIMRRLVDRDPRYQLHVAGKFQDPALQLYWSHQVNQLGLSDNVVMYEWQSDIAAFLEDKHYLLSTSLHESFGYSIAEAMARGIKPVVHNFPFAGEMWAEEMLFNSVEEAVEIIASTEYNSAAYRAFIQEHYSLENQVIQIRELISSVVREASGEVEALTVTEILGIEPRMVNAEVQCRCPGCRSRMSLQVQTIAGLPVGRERCPGCGRSVRLDDDAYEAALLAFSDEMLAGDLLEENRAIRKLAEEWAQHPAWSRVMTVDGHNLGSDMEFEILPRLVQAWMRTRETRETT